MNDNLGKRRRSVPYWSMYFSEEENHTAVPLYLPYLPISGKNSTLWVHHPDPYIRFRRNNMPLAFLHPFLFPQSRELLFFTVSSLIGNIYALSLRRKVRSILFIFIYSFASSTLPWMESSMCNAVMGSELPVSLIRSITFSISSLLQEMHTRSVNIKVKKFNSLSIVYKFIWQRYKEIFM